MKKLTPTQEDYLKVIYLLTNDDKEVRITDIAARMGISKPSVNRAVANLKTNNLVEHEHYGSITLTSGGEAVALNIRRKHLIIKKFLMKVLSVDEETAEIESCGIEHIISDSTAEKLNGLLK